MDYQHYYDHIADCYCNLHHSDLEPKEFTAMVEATQLDISKIMEIINIILQNRGTLDFNAIVQMITMLIPVIWPAGAPAIVQLILAILPLLLNNFLENN